MANIFSKVFDLLNETIDSRIEDLKKGNPEGLAKAQTLDGSYVRKGLLFDPFTDQSMTGSLFRPKQGFLPNYLLKQVSRRDTVVASIIDTRASQVASFCKRPENRFEDGFRIVTKDKTIVPDLAEIREIEEFILNVGYTNERAAQDKMSFGEWGYAITRDWLIYGVATIEKVLRNDQRLYSFLPISAECVYHANKSIDKKQVEGIIDTWRRVIDSDKIDLDRAIEGDYSYLQCVDGKVIEGWSENQMIFAKINVETDMDLRGYACGPLERAIQAINSNLNIDNSNRSFFTHGLASKGLLVVQGDVTPNALRALQTQWNNQITGPLNAWRTPILAGIKGVQWVPLTATNRDMEWAAYQDAVLRKIFAAFAMDPEEAGFGYLSKGQEQRTLSESSNEWKITASRDRGLRPILGRIEAIINEDVLVALNPAWAEKYHFQFVGLDAETKMEELQRLEAEMTLITSINEARKATDKDEWDIGGNLVLNPLLLQTLQVNMTKGMFMEKFLGIQGASERPDLQYIPDPLWFQFQTLLMQLMNMQAGFGGPQPRDAHGHFSSATGPAGNANKGDSKDDDSDDKEAQEAAEQQAQAQQEAIQNYMAANPDVFKHIKQNLASFDALRKAVQFDSGVDKHAKNLVSKFKFVTEEMIREIMEAVKEDIHTDKGGDLT